MFGRLTPARPQNRRVRTAAVSPFPVAVRRAPWLEGRLYEGRRRQVAIHESSHACALRKLGAVVLEVSCEPSAHGLGFVRARPRSTEEPLIAVLERATAALVGDLATRALTLELELAMEVVEVTFEEAEQIASAPRYRAAYGERERSSDLVHAEDARAVCGGDELLVQHLLNFAARQAELFLQDASFRREVEELADRLMEHGTIALPFVHVHAGAMSQRKTKARKGSREPGPLERKQMRWWEQHIEQPVGECRAEKRERT